MTVGLLALGALIFAVGLGMIGFGIPINEFSLGNTLIIAGTVAVVGGVLMVGLAVVVRQLIHLNELIVQKPVLRAGRVVGESFESATAREIALQREIVPQRDPAPIRETPAAGRQAPWRQQFPQPHRAESTERAHRLSEPRFSPTPADTLEEQIAERPRQVFPSPSRLGSDPQLVEAAEEAPLSPRVPPRTPARASAPNISEFPLEPKVWSPNPARPAVAPRAAAPERQAPAAAAAENWLNGSRPKAPEAPEFRGEATQRAREDIANGEPHRGHAPAQSATQHTLERRPVAILKSGVVDGMAYTLYTDGSIEAELTEGVVRFGSIEELRTHLEKSA